MFEKNNTEKAREIVKDFFKKTTFEVDVQVKKATEGSILIDLKMEDPQICIGQGGETLMEIQHLLKMMIYRKIGETIFIEVDINDYKKKKADYLKEMARSLADEAALIKKERVLPPMTAYERRIIHTELSGRIDVSTESVGEGLERKVVIKPKL